MDETPKEETPENAEPGAEGEGAAERRGDRPPRRRRRRRRPAQGIYVLPALLTTGSMFCGFFAVISAIDFRFTDACWAIFAAGIFDAFDGLIARATKTTSEFGVNYDSLSDLVSFGFAPAILAYNWALIPYQRIGWMAAFIYCACAAIRLARFNVHTATDDEHESFCGLPSPAAAGLIVGAVFVHQKYNEFCGNVLDINGVEGTAKHWGIVVLVYVAALLMVSEVRFRSIKDIDFMKKKRVIVFVAILLLLFFAVLNTPVFAFTMAYLYAAGGILAWLFSLFRRPEYEDDDEEEIFES